MVNARTARSSAPGPLARGQGADQTERDMRRTILPNRGRLLRLLAVSAAAVLAACAAVGPDYVPPQGAAPPSWHTALAGGLSTRQDGARTVAHWWERFEDPVLASLVEGALRGSPDMREAVARVREARARRGLSRTGLFPSLDASGDAAFSGEIENEVEETVLGGDATDEGTSKRFLAGFDAGWELDLFGGVRRSVEAAEAALQASRADLQDVWVSLAAEIALTYVEARTSQARLAVARANLEAQEETLALTRARHAAGLESELAVQQARYNLESTRARVPAVKAGLEASLNSLAVLQGKAPGAAHEALGVGGSIPVPPVNVVVGIPALVLRQRPDVRGAERELAAQTARIGEATADLYPRVRLTGSIGLETLDLNRLGTTAVWPFGYGLSVQWPVFDAGRIRRSIEIQDALQGQALARYERTVLGALEEVENALSSYALEQDRLAALRGAAASARAAVELAGIRYQAGLIDFLEMLEAQRSLLGFQDQVAESEGAVTANLVRLYKALGGGWRSMALTEGPEGTSRPKEERSG